MAKRKRSAQQPLKAELPLPLIHLPTAAVQISGAPGGLLGWLVKFVREDPSKWLPGDAEAHGYRLVAFAMGDVSRPAASLHHWPESIRELSLPLRRDYVVALHGKLRKGLRNLVTETPDWGFTLPAEDLKITLQRKTPAGQKPAEFFMRYLGSLETMLWQMVAHLVVETDRLIACPQCKEPFLALRKMRFCTPKCAERWWNQVKVDRTRKGGTR